MQLGLEILQHRKIQPWLYVLATLVCLWVIAKAMAIKDTTQPSQQISRGVEYLIDTNNELDISKVLNLDSNAWLSEQNEKLSFGMSHQPYWFKFHIPQLSQFESWLLEVDYPLLDHLGLWYVAKNQLLSEYHTGDSLPFRARHINHEKYLFPIPAADTDITVYVRIQTSGSLKLPIKIWRQQNYLVYNGENNIVMGLFFGFMAAMGLSNFFFFVTTRASNFLIYCGYVVCLALTLATLHGLGYKYLWPENIWLQGRSIAIFASATIFFAAIFSHQLLDIAKYSNKLDKLMRATIALFLFLTVLAFIVPYDLFIKSFLVLVIFVMAMLYAIGLYVWRKGHPAARIYTLAWTTLLISGVLASLDNLDLVDFKVQAHYLLMLGATIETMLLALVLAINYNQQKQDIADAQDEVIRLQEETKADLEYKVDERTLELQIALRELSETNRELEEKNTIDALTGIRNRLYFDKKLLAEVRRSRREQTILSVAMLDLDHFKAVNDNKGHLVGDECLRFVAKAIQSLLKRPSDDICRYGGEEFALLLPNTNKEGALQLLESVRAFIEQNPVMTASGEVKLTISGGLTSTIVDAHMADDLLLDIADKALYKAKHAGRNRVEYLDPQFAEQE